MEYNQEEKDIDAYYQQDFTQYRLDGKFKNRDLVRVKHSPSIYRVCSYDVESKGYFLERIYDTNGLPSRDTLGVIPYPHSEDKLRYLTQEELDKLVTINTDKINRLKEGNAILLGLYGYIKK